MGNILVRRGYITRQQLNRALMAQMASKEPIGEVLVDSGAISRFQRDDAVYEQQTMRTDAPSLKALVELERQRSAIGHLKRELGGVAAFSNTLAAELKGAK